MRTLPPKPAPRPTGAVAPLQIHDADFEQVLRHQDHNGLQKKSPPQVMPRSRSPQVLPQQQMNYYLEDHQASGAAAANSSSPLSGQNAAASTTSWPAAAAKDNGKENDKVPLHAAAAAPAVAAGKPKRKPVENLKAHVGLDGVPDLIRHRSMKTPFEFSLMVVGQSGLGKSTFVNSLFQSDIHPADRRVEHIPQTVSIIESDYELSEGNVNMRLRLVDTPGFGDAVDNSNCWQPLVDYIDKRYATYLNSESAVNRPLQTTDTRVHCCLYFIEPNGHALRALDVECMRSLHNRVNLVPVIAKADTLTNAEMRQFKLNIQRDLELACINVYAFDTEAKSNYTPEMIRLKEKQPFAVIGSNVTTEVDGKVVRCRDYPWGIVEVENVEHNDFCVLRDLIMKHCLLDLRDRTDTVHYENYRRRQLRSGATDPCEDNPLMNVDAQRAKLDAELLLDDECREKELQKRLAVRHAALERREEELKKRLHSIKSNVEEKRVKLEERRAALRALHQQHPGVSGSLPLGSKLSLNSDACSEPSPDSKEPKKKRALKMFKGH